MNSYYVIIENGLLALMREVNNAIQRPATSKVRLVQVLPPYAGIQEHTAIMEVADESPPQMNDGYPDNPTFLD